MADLQDRGQPIRSPLDVDNKVQTKLVDYNTPSQGVTIDASGFLHSFNDGVYSGGSNPTPSSIGLIGHTRGVAPATADQGIRFTGGNPSDDLDNANIFSLDVSSYLMGYDSIGGQWDRLTSNSGSLNVSLTGSTGNIGVNIFDEAGVAFSRTNPLPVYIAEEAGGTEVHNYLESAAVAGAASVNHDYTVSGGSTLMLRQVIMSASSRANYELQIETGVGAGTFDTKYKWFLTETVPSREFTFAKEIEVGAGIIVRLVRTNDDNQAQDIYTTLIGEEV